MVSLTVYDGANGIGGNKIYVGENDKGVFLDLARTSANTVNSTRSS